LLKLASWLTVPGVACLAVILPRVAYPSQTSARFFVDLLPVFQGTTPHTLEARAWCFGVQTLDPLEARSLAAGIEVFAAIICSSLSVEV